MNHDTYQPISHYLSKSLYALLTKVKELSILNQQLRTILPSRIQAQCQVSNKRDHCLILTASHAAIAAEVYLYTPQLLKQLHDDFKLQEIQQIQCKVNPSLFPILNRSTIKNNPMSIHPKTATLINTAAQTLNDIQLKHIMEKIAKHCEKIHL